MLIACGCWRTDPALERNWEVPVVDELIGECLVSRCQGQPNLHMPEQLYRTVMTVMGPVMTVTALQTDCFESRMPSKAYAF